MKISVIIPLYNKESSLSKSINSLYNQLYKDFEVIIVDDGSTDRSLEIAKEIKDPRFRVFSKNNEGVSIARNYGAERAQGDYLAFLDADDEWSPDFLREMNKAINQYPDAEFITGSYVLARGDHRQHKIIGNATEPFVIDNYCKTFLKYKTALCCVGTVCVKKSLFEEVGKFPPKVKRGEDHDLWLRLACRSSLLYLPKPYLQYNLDAENNSRGKYGSHKLSFSYWKWFDYDYKDKKSLLLYTDYFILGNLRGAIKYRVISSIWFWFKKLVYYNVKGIINLILKK